MKTVAIAINKGGSGKTTLTRSLGTAATAAGLNVLVLDMDIQQSATQWGRRRKEPLPMVRFTRRTIWLLSWSEQRLRNATWLSSTRRQDEEARRRPPSSLLISC